MEIRETTELESHGYSYSPWPKAMQKGVKSPLLGRLYFYTLGGSKINQERAKTLEKQFVGMAVKTSWSESPLSYSLEIKDKAILKNKGLMSREREFLDLEDNAEQYGKVELKRLG